MEVEERERITVGANAIKDAALFSPKSEETLEEFAFFRDAPHIPRRCGAALGGLKVIMQRQ